ncbi:MAG TPA: NAD-dependent malic enzyme [Anaeromyxobacteraceae bacterium]|nr:NAD-dependent malic enzyme [Anaeromyxobacteraceae bacterium]
MDDNKFNRPEARVGIPTGHALLRTPLLNKGTAFTEAERMALGLHGLLPPHVFSIQEQVERSMEQYRLKTSDLDRYLHLIGLQDRNETLFYRVLTTHLEEMLPIVYTPTVGLACQKFGHIFRRPRGMYVSIEDRGYIGKILRNWPQPDVRVIVMTDGERILGLGDQGVCGMGIPIGKLSLYTGCAGIPPSQTLPLTLDVGTENQAYLDDPLYMGVRHHRVRGPELHDFVTELIEAIQDLWPKCLVQFEDFGNANAFDLLERWRDRICTFNDDIQGTAAVALAGIYSALRITRKKLIDQKVLFLGAGEAGVGIGDLIASAMVDEGVTPEEARQKCWFVDSKGLVVKSRTDLAHHKLRFAHDHPRCPDFLTAVKVLKPSVVIGVSTIAKSFNQEVVDALCQVNERPIIFALSNPTSKSECTAEEAYTFSRGRAIFASGSPFPPCTVNGKTFEPGQGNNSYIFPGVGLGAYVSEATRITDQMFSEAARALAGLCLESDLAVGRIYPALGRIREVSAILGAAVAEVAFKSGLARVPRPQDVLAHVKSKMWEPIYPTYVS